MSNLVSNMINPQKIQSGTINILEVWLCSWCTYNHVRELKKILQLSNNKLCWFLCQIRYQIWPNPLKLQPGTINILVVWLCSWCTYNHDREQTIWIQLRNDKLCWVMMSNLISEMIQSSKTPVRNHQRPPSMTVFLMHF